MLMAVAALLLPASAQALTANQTVLVDRLSGDAPLPYDGAGRGFIEGKAINTNGCYVVFIADSDPLFAGDDNGARNIYRLSRCDDSGLALVSSSSTGVPAEFGSQNTGPSISADGTRVAFASNSKTLTPESDGSEQIYVKDLTTGAIELVSRGDGPTGAPVPKALGVATISADGQHVAFVARGVIDTDNVNGVASNDDVFERSMPDNTTHMVSVTYPGEVEGGSPYFVSPGISHDGKVVTFISNAQLTADDTDTNIDAYIRQGLNGGTEVTRLVSFENAGQPAGADQTFNAVDVSDDGTHVAWPHNHAYAAICSPACSLATVRDVAEGGANTPPSVQDVIFPRTDGTSSPDNLFFQSSAPLVAGDTNGKPDLYSRTFSAPTTILMTDGTSSQGIVAATATDDGALVAFEAATPELPASGGFLPQAYVRQRPSGTTTLISAPDRLNEAGDADITRRAVSADGRYVVFQSDAPAFGGKPRNFTVDEQVLLRDVTAGTTTLLSTAADGTVADRRSGNAEIDSAGDRVVFNSNAGNLPGAAGDHIGHAYVRDIASGTVRMLDMSPGGSPGDKDAFGVAISGDGKKAAFVSTATNLPDSTGDGMEHLYLVDLASGAMQLVDRASDGTISNGNADDPDLNADGSRVAFQTGATNLGVATGGNEHVYVRDVPSSTLIWASVPESGNPADGFAHLPFLTADGHKVAFTSNSATFGYGQTDGTTHAFLRDLDSGAVTDLGAGLPGIYSDMPTLNADGTKASVVGGQESEQVGAYVRDVASATVSPGSARDGTTELVRGFTGSAALSASGSCLAFSAQSDNVVAGGYGPDNLHVYLRALDANCLPAPGGPGPDQKDTTAPVVSSFSVTNKRFALGAKKTAAAAKRRRAKRGTTFRFRLSENAAVRIVVARKLAGRRKGKRCVAPTRKLRRAKRCSRFKTRHTLRRAKDVAGLNRIAYSGRVGRTKLRPGTYRATLTATDAAGNRSRARTVSFRVVKR
jgi:Tol biopolymer transport system component